MKKGWLLVGAWVVLGLSGCLPDVEVPSADEQLQDQLALVNKVQLEADLKTIDDSLTRRKIVALKEPQGVRYVVHNTGTGPKPTLTTRIRAKYEGRLFANKTVFAKLDTIDITLQELIIGWQTTVPLMPEGSKFTLYIPSGYGYGPVDVRDNNGTVLIPRNSNLIFDIELLDVQ